MKKEYNLSKMKEVDNPFRGKAKKAVGINLSYEVIDYFKTLSKEIGISYQQLINLYLLDCAKQKKKISMQWVV